MARAKKSADEGDDSLYQADLGVEKRKVKVRQFKGISLIDIREYYQPKNEDEWKPSSKGISLTVEQWEALKHNMGAIDSALYGIETGDSEAKEKKAKKVKREDDDEVDEEETPKKKRKHSE
ncbi:unnamed protein product [Ambrosiozyma monospora]|uniref:Unnamed protein product n=1 Tax=Ambrosiozyma monospora TaxID=43982 RepID=A0ACB5SYE5_AMBMO|nr:unnamed protein product [Ambrosiozyma monospora]